MKKLKSILTVGALLLCMCISLSATSSTECDCYIKCAACKGKNINHYHPNTGSLRAQCYCRDCGYEWIEENPRQGSYEDED